MKKVLVINGHPGMDTFCDSLSQEYVKGLKKSKHKVKILNLRELKLSKYLKEDHKLKTSLSPDLIQAQEMIKWADHLVFTYPTWWASPPALVKLFIEIVFESGFAFNYKPKGERGFSVIQHLKGKSARLIVTMDGPPMINKILFGNAGSKMIGAGTLKFCGISPVKKSYFGSVKMSNEGIRNTWLYKAYELGLNEN